MVDVGNFDWILQLISKLASSYCCFISSIQLSFLIVDPPAPIKWTDMLSIIACCIVPQSVSL